MAVRVPLFQDVHPGTTFSRWPSGYHFFERPVRVVLFQDFGRREPGDGDGHLATGRKCKEFGEGGEGGADCGTYFRKTRFGKGEARAKLQDGSPDTISWARKTLNRIPASRVEGYFMRKQLKVNLKEFGNELE